MYEDTVALLQPTVVVLRVCGVCPSALLKLHVPTYIKIYAFCLVLIYLTRPVFFFLYFSQILSPIERFILILSEIADTIRVCVLILFSFLSSESLIKFFRIMESAQRSLYSLNIRQPPKPSKKLQILWLVILFSPKMLSIVHQLFVSYTLLGIPNLVHMVVATGTVCKIRVLLDLVCEKLELLNWHLDDLNNRWPVFLPRPPDVSFRELSCVREWRKSKFILEREDTRTVTPEKIRNFNQAHLKLVHALRTVNSAFSITVLAYIVSAVIYIMFHIPVGITIRMDSLAHFSLVCSITGEIVGLVTILSASSKVQEQVEKTALLVHDLLDEDYQRAEVVNELEQFSMALLHRKATFTAGGFFDVNLKLVSRVAGMLAPIILFLTQTLSKANRKASSANKNIVT